MKFQSKVSTDPKLVNVLYSFKNDIFKTFNSIKIGQVVSFNASKKTANIQILFKRTLDNGNTQSVPVLRDCPVFTLQGGGSYIEMPIMAGDQCIVLFSDRNIDAWYQNGAEAAPFDARCHDMSDGIALVGINALTSTLPAYDSTELKIVNGTGKLGIQGNKLTITNGTITLLTVINGLINVIKTLTVAGAPIDAAGLSALETYKTTVSGLLY